MYQVYIETPTIKRYRDFDSQEECIAYAVRRGWQNYTIKAL